jgi:hypothetical protein
MLREKNDKECKQHVLEMKEFTRVLHHDAKLHGFMGLKNRERELMESHAQRTERKNLAKLYEMDLTLASYQQSLKEILALSHFDSMERLVASYNAREQDNFSCFKCITDLNHEVGKSSMHVTCHPHSSLPPGRRPQGGDDGDADGDRRDVPGVEAA